MKKEFIPYEQALALKELGFDDICFGYYEENYPQYIRHNKGVGIRILYLNEDLIRCPLYQQAFRWFREKHYHYAFLQPTSDLISENYCFKILDQYSGKFYSKSYEKYEEAELECLKKLIEIVRR